MAVKLHSPILWPMMENLLHWRAVGVNFTDQAGSASHHTTHLRLFLVASYCITTYFDCLILLLQLLKITHRQQLSVYLPHREGRNRRLQEDDVKTDHDLPGPLPRICTLQETREEGGFNLIRCHFISE